MIVMKFGGSSLKNPARIKQVAGIVKKQLARKPIIVVSAHGLTTDWLLDSARSALSGHSKVKRIIDFHRRLVRGLGLSDQSLQPLFEELRKMLRGISGFKKLTPRRLDQILSYGERFSCRIMSDYFRTQGIPARPVESFKIGLMTDSDFGQAVPLAGIEKKIASSFKNSKGVPVVTGFLGRDNYGQVTTLGRNGSDYSAAIIGAAGGAKEIQLWSDVDGIMTVDPRLVNRAVPVARMSFNEASELAYYGGRFHPSTLIPAIKKNIPVRILNMLKPDWPGTSILKKCSSRDVVKSIVYKKNLQLINIISTRMLGYAGFLAKIFDVFAKHKVVLDMIATSEVSVSVTTDSPRHLARAIHELAEFAEVKILKNKAIICVVGERIRKKTTIADSIFTPLKRAGIKVHMISQGATLINIAFVVDNRNVRPTVKILHRAFFRK